MQEERTGVRRERKDAQRNLERVLEAARELFAERGGEVTMEEVARRAGVGVGTVYRRFANKEQLFAAVSQEACGEVRHSMHAVAGGCDPITRLRALFQLQYRRCAQQAALLDLRPEEARGCGLRHEQQLLYAAMREMLEQTIVEAQRQGRMRCGDPAALATLCLELLHPHSFHSLARVVGGSPDDAAECALQFVLGGLGAS
jgi:AcrR family transcriptional regulator